MSLSGSRGVRGTAGEARAAQTRANREETERELSKTLRESSEKMVALVNLLKEMHGAETGAQRVAAENARNVWEDYDNAKSYVPGNKVAYNGSSYLNIAPCSGVLPSDTEHWLLIAAKGVDGEGAGDMLASVYDPQRKAQDIFAYVDNNTVPKTRKVNGKALDEDIDLNAKDVGALTQSGADGRYFQLRGTSQMGESLGGAPYNVEFTEEEDDSFPASSVGYSNETSGLAAETAQAAIDELAQEKAGAPKRIAISIPTTGWTDNQQTFTVTGIPADPTTYEVHLAQVGAANVAAAMACGIYIADEAQNSLTLAVNSAPETAFQVYAVVQGVSV